jgi:hypothetical protein
MTSCIWPHHDVFFGWRGRKATSGDEIGIVAQ